jgi:hypothetical protein
MAGYTRQKTYTDGDVIQAAHTNEEFDQLVAAFAASTGHAHDGSTGSGGPIAGLLNNTLTFGVVGTTADTVITFTSSSNTGQLAWDVSADNFEFRDDVLLKTTQKLYFNDTGTYIFSNADGDLDLVSDGTSADSIKLASAGGVTLDVAGDITLDADGGDVVLKDDGTQFGSLTNTSGNLILKSGSTTALTFSGANATFAGTVTIGSAEISEAELEILDGATVTTDELNYNDTGASVGTVVASKTVTVDANKDVSSFRNITLSGELDAGSLDVSGDADIDGTLEADAITVNGTALATVIAGTTVTTATNANHVSVADNENTNEENLIPFIEDASATGNVGLESDGDFSYNPSTGTVTATIFKGNVDAVDGDFDGTLEADAITVGGVALSEVISDTAGAMFSSNTESGVTVTYQDDDNTIDVAIDAAQTGITSLLATDIKIGEDNETKIDFETADEIHFYAANAEQVYVADGIFGPQTDSDVDLGTTGVRWKDAYIDTITTTGAITVGGDLTVNGTTTTVNSTTVTIDDPIFTLGGDSAPGSDDNKDRGIEFRYHNGSAAKVGFFGFDDSAGKFTFIPDASNSSEVFSGTAGTIVANLEGAVTGNVTGNVSGTAATVTGAAQSNITSLGTLTTLTVDNVIVNGTTIGHTDDTDLMTLADGVVTVAGEVSMTTLDIGGTNVGSTAEELNLLDGSAKSTSSITIADADAFIVIDGTTTKQIPASDLKTYASGASASKGFATAMAIAL